MEDNSSSNDENKDTPISPKFGGKKIKLNDGSSQDIEETVTASGGENADSGVSADKSESTSSEGPAAAPSQGPSNMVLNSAVPSVSNIRTMLLNIRRPNRGRNYRKRKSPDRDSNSNSSSRDSDDLSAEESVPDSATTAITNSDPDSDDLDNLVASFAEYTPPGETSSSSSSSSNSNDSYVGDALLHLHSHETDSEEEAMFSRSHGEDDNDENHDTPNVLLKSRPKHNYMFLREIINREMGLTFPCGKTTKNDVLFEKKFYGSLHAVHRLKKLHQLNKHKGCVNAINFHPEGNLLASGSDDTNVIIWDWARNKALHTIKTLHKSNVFQSKFLYLNARSQLNIVTCARDGQVRLLQVPSSGGACVRRRLAAHARAAHKLHVCPHEPHLVTSAGEDGVVMQSDVRTHQPTRLFQVENRHVVPLYSVCGHPLDPSELLVAGRDKYVRVYDKRNCAKPLAMYCPNKFNDSPVRKRDPITHIMHLTCAVYNYNGTEILGSYNDEDIYLFDAKKDVYDKANSSDDLGDGYTHRYSGHRNSATFKAVAFFGPNSEYIVSGSDCSYIYIWEKKSEAIVQWMVGDVNGVVNCIESHPRCPVMATSGLDKDVKIWVPKSDKDPSFSGIEKVVRENCAAQQRSPLFNDFLPTLYSAWRDQTQMMNDEDGPTNYGNIDFDGNVCSVF